MIFSVKSNGIKNQIPNGLKCDGRQLVRRCRKKTINEYQHKYLLLLCRKHWKLGGWRWDDLCSRRSRRRMTEKCIYRGSPGLLPYSACLVLKQRQNMQTGDFLVVMLQEVKLALQGRLGTCRFRGAVPAELNVKCTIPVIHSSLFVHLSRRQPGVALLFHNSSRQHKSFIGSNCRPSVDRHYTQPLGCTLARPECFRLSGAWVFRFRSRTCLSFIESTG